MKGAGLSDLSLRTPPRFGRRAVWSTLAACGLVGLSFLIDEAAANQVGYSKMPAIWALFFAAVALYYAAICAFRWFRHRNTKEDAKPPCQSAADIL